MTREELRGGDPHESSTPPVVRVIQASITLSVLFIVAAFSIAYEQGGLTFEVHALIFAGSLTGTFAAMNIFVRAYEW